MTLSTLRHIFKGEDNSQILHCVVDRYTLIEPDVTSVPITVFCKYIVLY